jgi:hypothetical protein
MVKHTLDYNTGDVPTIHAFLNDDAFIRGLMGPFGSGKSSGCLWDIVQRGLKQKPGLDGIRRSRWAVIRNTYRQLNDTTIRTVHQWFPYPMMGQWRATEHEYVLNKLIADGDKKCAEIELLFRALDRPDHVRNLLSLDLTGAWVNEAREVPWTIIDALQGRVDRYPAKRDGGGATWAGIILDTNPPDADSAWYRFFEKMDHTEAVEGLAAFMPGMTVAKYCRIFKQPSGLSASAENAKNQSPGYWQRLAIGKTDEWVKVYCRGEYGFVTEGRPVFPEYHDNVHCPGGADEKRAPRTDPRLPVHRGWDFGLTPSCIFSQLAATGQWKIVDELCADTMGVDRFSDQVLSHSSQHFPDTEFIDVGDPAGNSRAETDERTCFDILHTKGIMIEPGLQSPQIRQECIRKQLRQFDDDGRPAFNLHPRCGRLRRALQGGYHYRRIQIAGTERWADKPEKNLHSHPADALQYTATRLFGPSMQWRGDQIDNDMIELNSRLVQDRTRSKTTGY